jgi:hypothetical protein
MGAWLTMQEAEMFCRSKHATNWKQSTNPAAAAAAAA